MTGNIDKKWICHAPVKAFLAAGLLLLSGNLAWQVATRLAPTFIGRVPAGEHLPEPKPFKFGVVGDSRRNVAVLRSILRDAEDRQAQFMLHGGDIVRAPNQRQYNWVLHELAESGSRIPIYAVPGNHDIVMNAPTEEERYKLYCHAFGPRHYWFGIGRILFVAFDDAMVECNPEELKWLDQTLSHNRPDYEHCFVIMHVPPYDPRRPEGGHCLNEEDGRAVMQILKRHHVSAIFASHIHSYAEGNQDGIPLYITGGGGANRDDPSEPYHYLLCTVGSDGLLTVEKKDMGEIETSYLEYAFHAKWFTFAAQIAGLALVVTGIVFAMIGRNR